MDIIIKKYYSKPRGKYPSFIKTLKGVGGRTRADKLKKLKKVLSKCRRMGISLTRGKSFKSYRSLVSRCSNKITNEVKKINTNLVQGNEKISKLLAERDSLMLQLKHYNDANKYGMLVNTSEKNELLKKINDVTNSLNEEGEKLRQLNIKKTDCTKMKKCIRQIILTY